MFAGLGRMGGLSVVKDHTLTLRYDFTRTFQPIIGPVLTYSGGANGTYFDSSGILKISGTDEPRLDHSLSGVPLGLLIEQARTWRALHNRDLTNAVWTASNMTPLKDATGLDGVVNSASTLTATAANGTMLQTVTIVSGERTVSVYVKRKTGTGNIDITDNNGTNWTTLTGLSSTDWTRHHITRTQANPVFGLRIVTSGDEVEVDFIGLEEGAIPTSAVEVGASAVTRTEENITTTDVGWFNASAGTWLVSASIPIVENTPAESLIVIDDGGSTDRQRLRKTPGSTTDFNFNAVNSAGNNATVTIAGVLSDATAFNVAVAYSQDDTAASVDGGAVGTDITADFPAADAMTTLRLGRDSGSAQFLNGHIARIKYFNVRKNNADLRNLTV